ncbi:MAG: amidohydrolase family protein [Gammaproteobacteria bacterium]|nr:amidohydrolase family protein [Gammaproteobacteria bacterium]
MANIKSKISSRYWLPCAAIVVALLGVSCAPSGQYYSREDYSSVAKTDAHVHLNTMDPALVNLAIADNFTLLTVNVDYGDFPLLVEQKQIALAMHKAYPDTVQFVTTFSMDGWEEPGFSQQVVAQLKEAREQGAVAVKVWKNIGMDIRDKDGHLLMVDDQRLDPIFSYLENTGFPLLGHQGEPHNCWLPLEQMTVTNDREYFAEHPQYHMFLHPDMPGYNEQMAARDRRLQRNSKLNFVGAHLASLEWNVDKLAAFLDEFPLANVDMAARMGQLQYQSKQDEERVRNFLIKYQDRIMYATDLTHAGGEDGAGIVTESHAKWFTDWLYLATDERINVPEVEGEFSGLKLPKSVVDKIYHSNASRFMQIACSADSAEKGCLQ